MDKKITTIKGNKSNKEVVNKLSSYEYNEKDIALKTKLESLLKQNEIINQIFDEVCENNESYELYEDTICVLSEVSFAQALGDALDNYYGVRKE